MKKTISILTESTILGKIPIIFGQIDKAYKVHVKGLTFCTLPLTIHGPFLFFVFEKLPYMDLNHSIHVPSFHLYFITPYVLQKDQLLRQLNDYFLKKLEQVPPVVHGKQNVTTPTNSPFTNHNE